MQRYFPFLDYDLKDSERVKVKIIGKIIDDNYTKLLYRGDIQIFSLYPK